MAAKGKYSDPEIIRTICTTIALTGSDKAAYEAAGISHGTFYKWINSDKVEFVELIEGIARAREEYRRSLSDEKIRQANKALNEYLYGEAVEEWGDKTTISNIHDGEVKSQRVMKTAKTIKRGVPQWAIERVLGKPLDVLEAIKTLVEAGILPRWIVPVVSEELANARKNVVGVLSGSMPDGAIEPQNPGLSDETIAAIQTRILGITEKDRMRLSEDT